VARDAEVLSSMSPGRCRAGELLDRLAVFAQRAPQRVLVAIAAAGLDVEVNGSMRRSM